MQSKYEAAKENAFFSSHTLRVVYVALNSAQRPPLYLTAHASPVTRHPKDWVAIRGEVLHWPQAPLNSSCAMYEVVLTIPEETASKVKLTVLAP